MRKRGGEEKREGEIKEGRNGGREKLREGEIEGEREGKRKEERIDSPCLSQVLEFTRDQILHSGRTAYQNPEPRAKKLEQLS